MALKKICVQFGLFTLTFLRLYHKLLFSLVREGERNKADLSLENYFCRIYCLDLEGIYVFLSDLRSLPFGRARVIAAPWHSCDVFCQMVCHKCDSYVMYMVCHVMLCHVHVMLCHVHGMLCYVMSCHVMSCRVHVMLCPVHVMLCTCLIWRVMDGSSMFVRQQKVHVNVNDNVRYFINGKGELRERNGY